MSSPSTSLPSVIFRVCLSDHSDHWLVYPRELPQSSLDEKKAQAVVDEIKLAGGDALAVGGDVSADDFPEKVISATIKYVVLPRYGRIPIRRRMFCF